MKDANGIESTLFGDRVDNMLLKLGFQYRPSFYEKHHAFDLSIYNGTAYVSTVVIKYCSTLECNSVIMLYCLGCPSVVYIKSADDISKKLLKGFIKVCRNPVERNASWIKLNSEERLERIKKTITSPEAIEGLTGVFKKWWNRR